MAEDEARIEVEAVQAVYGDDCLVISESPPHLHVRIKPRTADVTSEQFVEAVLDIRASPQYPMEEPHISIEECKGLDKDRLKLLLDSLKERAHELNYSQMLVALCEEAVERLSGMNHPDGNCPLCLYPLVPDMAQPYMKLMSCFHCFHSACVIKWLGWLQAEHDAVHESSSANTIPESNLQDMRGLMEGSGGKCPVCRAVFHAEDIEHVIRTVVPHCETEAGSGGFVEGIELLNSDAETLRRQKFEAVLRIQHEKGGLIEPKQTEVLRPGMFPPRPTVPPATVPHKESGEPRRNATPVALVMNSRGNSSRAAMKSRAWQPQPQNVKWRKQEPQNPRKSQQQWVKKETGAAR